MNTKTNIEISMPFKFKLHQLVIHKNGDAYVITGLPDAYRIEATGEPAYAYCKLNKDNFMPIGCNWIRAQSVMEEAGRYTAMNVFLEK